MTEFEQTQSIVSRIQQILREYPYGDAVLLELLQNADDARAACVRLVLQDADAAAAESAAPLPTLLFYNSATFSDRDLTNIQFVGGAPTGESKRHDGTKVGRFGIGFNAAFHLCDVVMFASHRTVVVFDPARENIPPGPGKTHRVGGMRWDFVAESANADALLETEQGRYLHALLGAFERAPGFGFRRDRPFEGTLFRLPLRQRPSTLWREVRSLDHVRALMHGFHGVARLGLVLLKFVREISAAIEVAAPHSDGSVCKELFRASAALAQDPSARLLEWLQRYTDVMRAVAQRADLEMSEGGGSASDGASDRPPPRELPPPCAVDAVVDVTVAAEPEFFALGDRLRALVARHADPNAAEPVAGGGVVAEAVTRERPAATMRFRVAHQLGPAAGWSAASQCWRLADECARYHHPIAVPWSATIVEARPGFGGRAERAALGRLMCFFPIGQPTALPVHVHGYFHLSSDRQSVAAVDRNRWNRAIVDEVMGAGYARAVVAVQNAHLASPFELWPLLAYTDGTAQLIAARALSLLRAAPAIFTASGTFACVADVVFACGPTLPLVAQRVVACRAPTIVAAVSAPGDGDAAQAEYALMRQAVVALGRSGVAVPVADAAFFRRALSGGRSQLKQSARASIPNAVAMQLLACCLDDKNYDAFLALGSALDVIPMAASGVGGPLLPRRAGAPNEGLLLLAPDEAAMALYRQFAFADRLVHFARPEHDAATLAFHVNAAKLADCGAIARLTPSAGLAEIAAVLARPAYRLVGDTWFLEARGDAERLVAVGELVAFFSTLTAPNGELLAELRKLPLVPCLPLASSNGVSSGTLTTSSVRDCCCSMHVLIVADGCSDADEDDDDDEGAQLLRCAHRAMLDVLTTLGAREADTQLFPLSLLRRWHRRELEGPGTSGIFVVDAGPSGAAAALQALRQLLPSGGKLRAAQADALCRYAALCSPSLSEAALSFLAGVAMLPAIAGGHVAARSAQPVQQQWQQWQQQQFGLFSWMQQAVPVPAAVVVVHALPDGLPDAAVEALSTGPLEDALQLVALPRTEPAAMLRAFAELMHRLKVPLLPRATSLALALPRVVPPATPEQRDGAAETQTAFFEALHALVVAKGEQTPLLQRALNRVAQTRFLPNALFPTSASGAVPPRGNADAWLAPVSCIDVTAAVHDGGDRTAAASDPELLALLLHLGRRKLSASRVALLDAVIPAACIGSARQLLRIATRLEGDALVAVVMEFLGAAATTDNDDDDARIEHAYALLRAVESALASPVAPFSAKAVAHLAFVPAMGNAVDSAQPAVVLRKPGEVCSEDAFALFPVADRLPLLPVVAERARAGLGLHHCARAFGWDVPPTLEQMLSYLADCNRRHAASDAVIPADPEPEDRDEVTAVAAAATGRDDNDAMTRKMYDYFEARLADQDMRRALPSNMGDAATFRQRLKSGLVALYFPERGLSFAIACLALNERAAGLSPFLMCVDAALAAAVPRLVRLLDIPARHSAAHVRDVIAHVAATCVVDDAASRRSGACARGKRRALTAMGRRLMVAGLEYLVVADPAEARRLAHDVPGSAGVLVPTTDGRTNHSRSVLCDFFAVDEASHSDETLHLDVPSTVARALGMGHTGLRFAQQLCAKQQQLFGGSSAFRARGQRQSVTDAIKRVLSDYCDVQAILLEMLQNADDAGAREVRFTLDLRSFATDEVGLLSKEMARLQGPALTVFNDREFTAADLDAIMELGCGHKRGDHLCIGRFGLGFNTAFHLTDCPSFVTGDTTVFLDPSLAHLGACVPLEAPGLVIQHTQEPNLARRFPHQFAPYQCHGVDFRARFPGTLFRLPLRRETSPKSLSERTWSPADVRGVFSEFSRLMPHLMLFLRHVQSITLCEVGDAAPPPPPKFLGFAAAAAVGGAEARELAFATLDNDREVSSMREEVAAFIGAQHPEKRPGPSLRVTCPVQVRYRRIDGRAEEHQAWLVSIVAHSINSPLVPQMKCPDSDVRRKLIPVGACALLLDAPRPSFAAVNDAAEASPRKYGFVPDASARLHCYLPLPTSAGLPFHAHGCFALSSDRRGMWLSSLGSTASWETTWNTFILDSLIPSAVACALATHAPLAPSPAALARYFAAWPLTPVAVAAGSADAPAAPASSDILATLRDGFFRQMLLQRSALLWTHRGAFATCKEACLRAATAAGDAASSQLPDDLVQVVLGNDAQLCVAPVVVVEGLVKAAAALGLAPPQIESPKRLADAIRGRVVVADVRSVPFESIFPAASPSLSPCELLSRLTCHIVAGQRCPSAAPAAAAAAGGGHADLLHGAPLLLLSSGQVGIVDTKDHFFVAPASGEEVRAIFPRAVQCVLDHDYHRRTGRSFAIDDWELLGVGELTLERFPGLLRAHARDMISLQALGEPFHWDGNNEGPMGRWLAAVWALFRRWNVKFTDDVMAKLPDLCAWPLLPVMQCEAHVLMPLGETLVVSGDRMDDAVRGAWRHLRVCPLDDQFSGKRTVVELCNVAEFGSKSTGALLERALERGHFDDMPPPLRDSLREWLLQQCRQSVGLLSGLLGRAATLDSAICKLPIFEQANDCRWVYRDAVSGFAIPPRVPLSRLCNGMYRFELPEAGIRALELVQYFVQRVYPALRAVDNPALSLSEELEHLRLIADDRNLSADFFKRSKNLAIFPSELSRFQSSVAAKQPATLLSHVVKYIAERRIPCDEVLKEMPALAQRVQSAQLYLIRRNSRRHASELIAPIVFPKATIPDVVNVLMRANEAHFPKARVPAALWCDAKVKGLLVAGGIQATPSAEFLSYAANAFTTSMRSAPLVEELIAAGNCSSAPPVARNQYLRDLGVSIAQAFLEFSRDPDYEARLKKLCGTAFLPERDTGLPFAFSAPPCDNFQLPQLRAPSAMAHFGQRLACWT